MNINYKQPQFELFPANSATLEDVNKPKFLLANLTLSIESLVILSILGIMVGLFAFSLGVERGKHLAAQTLDERVSAAWNLAPRQPMLVPTAVKPAVIAPKVEAKVGNAGFVIAHKMPVVAKATVVIPAKPSAIGLAKTDRFTIQVATYKSEVYAKSEAMNLKAKGLQTFLIKKGDFWLVCLGQFQSQDSANGVFKKIQSKYRGSSVRRF